MAQILPLSLNNFAAGFYDETSYVVWAGESSRLFITRTRLRIWRGGNRVEHDKHMFTVIIATLFALLAGLILTPIMVMM